MDIDVDTLDIPETEYDARVTMPSSEFTRIVRDLAQLGESVRIEVSKEGVRFTSEGEAANGNVLLKPSDGTTSSAASGSKKGKSKKKDDDDEEDEDEDEDGDEEEDGEQAKKKKSKKAKVKKETDDDVDMEEDAGPDDDGEDEQEANEDEDGEGSGKKRKRKVRRSTFSFFLPQSFVLISLTSHRPATKLLPPKKPRHQRKRNPPTTMGTTMASSLVSESR